MTERTAQSAAGHAVAGAVSLLDRRLVAGLGLALLCLAVGAGAMRPIVNPDVGWHLAMGRYIVAERRIPREEPFTHTARGAPMVAMEWLSQVLYHGTVRATGLFGLRALHAGLAVVLVLLLFALLRREGVGPALALLAAFLYVVIARGRFQVRPHMLNLVFALALYGYLFVLRPALRPRQLAAVFGTMVLWANLHAGALLFALLLVLSAAVEFLEQKVAGRAPRPHDLARGNLRRLALLAGLACGAILITPNHVALLPHVLESQRINAALSREWFPITSLLGTPYGRPHALGAYFALAATTWLIALRALRRRRWAEVAVPLVLVNLPFASARFVGMAFAPLLLVFSELERWARVQDEGGRQGRRRGVRSAIVLLGALGMLLLFDPAVLSQRDRERTAAGLERGTDFRADLFPIEAMRFLEAVALRGRLFNSSNWGGYIAMRAYEQYPTFIAGDWVPTGDEVLTDSITVTNRLRGASATLDKWAIDLLLVERGWMTPRLRRSHGWIPLFQNANAEIYLRDHARNAADLRRVADYYAAQGVPFDPERGFEEQAAFEANRDWAKRFRVQRVHSSAFDAHGARRGVWRRSGW